MPDRSNLVYRYDGSLPGLLCCVFESCRTRRLPLAVWEEGEPLTTLASELTIPTDREEAARVWRTLRRLSPDAAAWVEVAFLSGEEDRTLALHDFLWETFQRGQSITGFLGDPVVARAFQLQRQVHNEAHLFIEFLRFRERRGVLAAQIEPKSFVLPLMGSHFAARFPGEAFLIHDLSHGAALLHQNGRMEIFPLAELEEESPEPQEEGYRRLWKRYYDTIAIRERLNPKCQMTHCPKRFWNHMLERTESAVMPCTVPAGRTSPSSPAAMPPPLSGETLAELKSFLF